MNDNATRVNQYDEETRKQVDDQNKIHKKFGGYSTETTFGGNKLIPMKTLDSHASETKRKQSCGFW